MSEQVVVAEEVKEEAVPVKRTTAKEFIIAWQTSQNRREVAQKLDVSVTSVNLREKKWRKEGVKLKEMPKEERGMKKLDVNALNAMIEELENPNKSDKKKK